MAGKQATVARSVFCAALTVALTLGLAAPVGSVTKRFKDHPGGAKGPHNIVQVVVDNTGNRIGVRVRHQGRRWAGRVVLRLDTGVRRGFEHVVTIRHAGGSSATFENRNGSRWRCGDRRAVSRPGRRFTQLTFRRTCAAGRAQRMSVTAIVDPRSGRNDRLRTAAVPRVAPPPPAPAVPAQRAHAGRRRHAHGRPVRDAADPPVARARRHRVDERALAVPAVLPGARLDLHR